MNISVVAKQTGFSSKMIRYYEEIGLLPPIKRTDAGYRVYQDEHVQSLNFIQHAKNLGFDTDKIRELLSLWHNKDRMNMQVKALALQHIDALKLKIKQFENMVDILQDAADLCSGVGSTDCPILEHISKGI